MYCFGAVFIQKHLGVDGCTVVSWEMSQTLMRPNRTEAQSSQIQCCPPLLVCDVLIFFHFADYLQTYQIFFFLWGVRG